MPLQRAFGQEIRKNANQLSPRRQLNKLAKLEAGAVVKPAKATAQGSPIAGQQASATAQAPKVQLAPTVTGFTCDEPGDDSHLHSLQYISRIMNHQFATETETLPRADYLENVQNVQSDPQQNIHKKMRTILLNWIAEVHQKFRLRQETMFLTVNLLDRYLSLVAIPRDRLQLVGCTAMWIACKYHEIYSPSIRDFTYISDNAFKKRQMIECEEKMVKILKFRVTVPNSLSFLRRFNKVCKGVMGSNADRINHMSNYLLERTLLDYQMLAYKPSLLAASCMYSAISLVGGEWHEELQRATRYAKEDMTECYNKVRYYVIVSDPKLASRHRSIVHKYSKEKYGMVAKLRPRKRH